jgi:hypothetical protein
MRINITRYDNYRDIIIKLSKDQKISYKSLAQSANIHTSYFSRVMGDNADFSGSQLFLIGKSLGLNEWEMEYFLLLGEYFSSSTSDHKNYLKNKIVETQKLRQKVISQLNDVETEFSDTHIATYYQEAVTAKIHMLLTIAKFRKNPLLICNKIMIPEHKLHMELQKLQSLGVISVNDDDEISVDKFHIHLDESSPVSPDNHVNWRLETIQYIKRRTPRPSDYHLSAAFSCDEKTKLKIKEMFKKFVIQAQKATSETKGQPEVQYISFDLY